MILPQLGIPDFADSQGHALPLPEKWMGGRMGEVWDGRRGERGNWDKRFFFFLFRSTKEKEQEKVPIKHSKELRSGAECQLSWASRRDSGNTTLKLS